MTEALFIGIDIGTQGTKAVLCRTDGTVKAESFCPSKLIRPDAAIVYEDPEDIFSSVIKVISELTAKAREESKKAEGTPAKLEAEFPASDPLCCLARCVRRI